MVGVATVRDAAEKALTKQRKRTASRTETSMALYAHQLAAIERANRCLAELRAAQGNHQEAIDALEVEAQDVRDKLEAVVARGTSHAHAR